MLFHSNTIINRAKEHAEIAANTFILAPISFSFPLRERAVLQYNTKPFILPHQQHCISKQIKNVQLSGLCVGGLLRRGGSGWAPNDHSAAILFSETLSN